MPIYEYRCASCAHEFEKIVRVTGDNPHCPECDGQTEKQISLSAFHLKGSGWYADGYGSKAAKSTDAATGDSAASSTASSDAPAAASKSDTSAPASSGSTDSKKAAASPPAKAAKAPSAGSSS